MSNRNSYQVHEIEKLSIDSCTFAKTILMVLVVLYHSIALWTDVWTIAKPVIESPILSFIALWLNSFHVYGFVIISGYLFYYLRHDINKYDQFIPFVVQKVKRLVVPAIAISIIWCVPFAVSFSHYDLKEIIINYIFGVSPNQLWFLWMLFWIFLISWVLFHFIEVHSLLSFLVSVAFYFVGLAASTKLPNIFQMWTACQFLILFWIGIKLRQVGTERIEYLYVFFAFLLQIALFCFDQFYSFDMCTLNRLIHYSVTPVIHMLGGLVVFFFLSWLSSIQKCWKDSKTFKFLARVSMPIYLFHQQIIYVSVFLLNGRIDPLPHAAINFVMSLVVSTLLSLFCFKYRPLRFLVGEK